MPFKFTNSASIEITHQEVGLDYLSDRIAMHPLLLWRSIWAKDETKFTQTVIKDCLLLDKSLCIPWLKYIIDLYSDLFKLPIHDNPGQVINLSKLEIKDTFMAHKRELRMREVGKQTTFIFYQTIDIRIGFQDYLSTVTRSSHHFVLIRLRLGIVHHLVSFPITRMHPTTLCPCDELSKQSTMHFMLFCNFYSYFRRFYLKPLLKKHIARTTHAAMKLLVTLDDPRISFYVASYIQKAIDVRQGIMLVNWTIRYL